MSASSLRERRPFVSADPFSRPGSAGFFHEHAALAPFQLALGGKPVEKKADITAAKARKMAANGWQLGSQGRVRVKPPAALVAAGFMTRLASSFDTSATANFGQCLSRLPS